MALTGASGFFGRYMSKAFLEVGAKLVMFSRSDRLHEQVRHYQEEFGKDAASAYQVDFYDRKELDATLRRAAAEHDVDVLINNAYDIGQRTGFNTDAGRLENSDYGQWLSAFESGIYWAVLATQVFGEGFQEEEIREHHQRQFHVRHRRSKPETLRRHKVPESRDLQHQQSGLIALTKYTASFWGQYGIRCNAIAARPVLQRGIRNRQQRQAQRPLPGKTREEHGPGKARPPERPAGGPDIPGLRRLQLHYRPNHCH